MAKYFKKNSFFNDVILNSVWLLGFSAVIMLLCSLFLLVEMDEFLRFVLGLLLMLPLFVLFYSRGTIFATKAFIKRNPAISPDKYKTMNRVPLYVSIVSVLPYAMFLMLFVLIGNIIPTLYPLQSIALYLSVPMSMCFKAVGLIPTLNGSNWYAVLSVGAFLILTFTLYLLGFVKALRDKERSFQEMINEMRFNTKL